VPHETLPPEPDASPPQKGSARRGRPEGVGEGTLHLRPRPCWPAAAFQAISRGFQLHGECLLAESIHACLQAVGRGSPGQRSNFANVCGQSRAACRIMSRRGERLAFSRPHPGSVMKSAIHRDFARDFQQGLCGLPGRNRCRTCVALQGNIYRRGRRIPSTPGLGGPL